MALVKTGAGAGGVAVALGPLPNTFGDPTTDTTDANYTASKAAAAVVRDAYALGDATWLALYDADRSFLVRLVWTGNAQAYQRRNAAGTAWEDVVTVAPGTRGPMGLPGTVPEPEPFYLGNFSAGTNFPPAGGFSRSFGVGRIARGPTLYTVPAGRRLGIAYRATIATQPKIRLNGQPYPDNLLQRTTNTVALGHHQNAVLLTQPFLVGGRTLVEVQFVSDSD